MGRLNGAKGAGALSGTGPTPSLRAAPWRSLPVTGGKLALGTWQVG